MIKSKKIMKTPKPKKQAPKARTKLPSLTPPSSQPIEKTFKVLGFPNFVASPTNFIQGKPCVYLASIDGKQVVLKVFQSEDKQESWKFNNENQVMSLGHDNILTSHLSGDFKPSEDSFFNYNYTASLYCKHQTFIEIFIEKNLYFNEVLCRTYFRQLVEGLSFLHSHGVSHLDLKLENLFLDDDFQLRISDFDLSYIASDSENFADNKNFLRLGSINFRAPEIIFQECADPQKADIYSLGIILFYFQNGYTIPFDERTEKLTNLRQSFDNNPSTFFENFVKTYPNFENHIWSEEFKNLFLGMVLYEPEKRMSIEDIKASKWYNGEVYSKEMLKKIMSSAF